MILGLQYNPTKYIPNQKKYGKNGYMSPDIMKYSVKTIDKTRWSIYQEKHKKKEILVNNSPIFILLGFFSTDFVCP